MRTAWTVDQIRRAEAAIMGEPDPRTGLAPHDDGTLMRRAAAGLATVVLRALRALPAGHAPARASGRTVHLLVGPGNNGGDALWAGAFLRRRNVRVRAFLLTGHAHEAGLTALLRAGGTLLDRAELTRPCDLIIDGLFGIGGRASDPDPDLRAALTTAPVVAVDVPSGLAADATTASGLRADRTVTFGGHKIAHLTQPERCGPVDHIDIGLDLPATGPAALEAWDPTDVAAHWPVPTRHDHKYTRGVVGIDAGSATYPGAARLAVTGALHAGAGMVRYTGTAPDPRALLAAFPSVVLAEGRCQAHVAGSGWGERDDARARVAALVADAPTVLDADALDAACLDGLDLTGGLLTPHAGELARLLDVDRASVDADPLGHARRAADRFGATVLLKGGLQYVATPGVVTVRMPVPGPGWTARAGSGDTLAGACGALLATGMGAPLAAVLAASLQALTAATRPGPWPPDELAAAFPATIARLLADPAASAPESTGTGV